MANRYCFIVLGMHRSGTSSLAGTLHRAGVVFGSDFIDPLPENPKGFYENKRINRLNQVYLKKNNFRWYSIIFKQKLTDDQYSQSLKKIILQDYDELKIFGVKEPRIVHFLNEVEEVLEILKITPIYVWIRRDAYAVANSILKRDSIPIWYSLVVNAHYQNKIRKFLKNKDYTSIHYDKIITGNYSEILNLFDDIEKKLVDYSINIDRKKGLSFIDSKLNRSDLILNKKTRGIHLFIFKVFYLLIPLFHHVGMNPHIILENFYKVRIRS